MRTFMLILFVAFTISGFGQFTGPENCLEMTGTPKYVNVPTSTSLSPTTAITIEAWIYATSWGPNAWSNTIVGKEDWASGSRGYVLRCGNNGRLSFNIGIGSSWQEVVTTVSVLNLNQWHHVVGTYSGTQLKIYVDGIEVGTFSITATITSSPYDMRIGESSYSTMSSRPFSGRIDEVRLWSTALAITEIRNYMCRPVTASHPNFTSLRGYWKLDEGGTSTTTADASGNNNTGTLVNVPVWVRSGVPLGETSAYSYTTPFAVSLDNTLDSISVAAFSPVPTGVQIYRISGQPSNLTLPPGYANTGFSDGYWGVRVFGAPNATYTFNLKLKSWPAAAGCMPTIIKRADNSVATWSVSNDYLNVQTLSVTLNATGRQEFMVYFGKNSVITYNGPLSICEGDSIVLSANSQPGFSYAWHQNNTPITGGSASSLVVKQSGDYYVVVTNSASCADTSDVKSIIVNPKPNVEIVAGGPVNFCQGDSVTLYVTGAQTYLWSNASSLDSIVVSQSGKYMVWGVDMNNCVDSSSRIVTVNPPPSPVITLTGPSLTTGNFSSYQWYFNSFAIAGANNQSHTPTQNGVYTVEVLDSNGCYAMSPTFIMTNVGLEEHSGNPEMLSLYPNPSKGDFAVIYNGAVPAVMLVTGIRGEYVANQTLLPNSITEINGLKLKPGVYLVRITSKQFSDAIRLLVTQ